jgi:prepilin-type processing-associated H-X9-DG protein
VRQRLGFTFTDLLILLILLAMVAPAITVSIHHTREMAYRVKCASNLKWIGTAIEQYGKSNRGKYPRTLYAPGSPLVSGTGVIASNPFTDPKRPKDNDLTSPWFLLLRIQNLKSELFICPVQNPSIDPIADEFAGAPSPDGRSNFTDWRKNLSYSFANLYPDQAVALAGYHLDMTTGAEFAIAADLNPGTRLGYDVTFPTEKSPRRDMQRANSQNHSWQGQNVLYGDGHVDFQTNAFCGVKRDNIYTVSGSTDGSITTSKTIVGSPRWSGDSVLLPVSEIASDPYQPEGRSRYLLSAVIGISIIAALVVILLITRKRRAFRPRFDC